MDFTKKVAEILDSMKIINPSLSETENALINVEALRHKIKKVYQEGFEEGYKTAERKFEL